MTATVWTIIPNLRNVETTTVEADRPSDNFRQKWASNSTPPTRILVARQVTASHKISASDNCR
jgi:hypothetical protein